MSAFLMVNLPIILFFLVGIILLIIEALIPGFGIAGIAGIISEFFCIVLIFNTYGPIAAFGVTLIIIAIIALIFSLMVKSARSGKLSKTGIILSHSEKTDEGYSSFSNLDSFLNKEGTSLTILRPTGIGEFDGTRLDVVTEGEFIEANSAIRIEKIEGSRIVVKQLINTN